MSFEVLISCFISFVATNEIKHEIKTSKDKINKDSNLSVQVKSEIEKVKSEIDSVTDSVKRDL